MFVTQTQVVVFVHPKQKVLHVRTVCLVPGTTIHIVVASHVIAIERVLYPTNVILQLAFVGAYWALKGRIVIDAPMDTTAFRTVDPATVILPEQGLVNVMRMEFVNVINMEHVFVSNMLREENVRLAKWEPLGYLKMNQFTDAKPAFALDGLIFAGRWRIMYGLNWVAWKRRNS